MDSLSAVDWDELFNLHHLVVSEAVEVELGGETYAGSYIVSGHGSRRLVTVSWGWYSKTTQVGGSPPRSIARMLLYELVRAGGLEKVAHQRRGYR